MRYPRVYILLKNFPKDLILKLRNPPSNLKFPPETMCKYESSEATWDLSHKHAKRYLKSMLRVSPPPPSPLLGRICSNMSSKRPVASVTKTSSCFSSVLNTGRSPCWSPSQNLTSSSVLISPALLSSLACLAWLLL